jgi:hypothetical protein
MSSGDHRAPHVWVTMAGGIVRCAEMACNAEPEPRDILRLEAEEAQRKAMRRDIRLRH